jgi:hypothetical protein
MNRIPHYLLFLLCTMIATGCLEKKVRLYIEADESCQDYCEGLTFRVMLANVEEGTLAVGERILIEKSIGSTGKLTVTVHNDDNVNNHPLKCQKGVDSLINIRGWTPVPEDQIYVYYNQIIYFQNKDMHAKITCEPPPEITEGACDDVHCWMPPPNYCIYDKIIEKYSPKGVCSEGECIYPSAMEPCWQGWCYDSRCEATLPCEGVYCHTPPKNRCADSSTVIQYTPIGVCNKGECVYDSREIKCTIGKCVSGFCKATPCDNFQCNKPPASHCVDDKTLRSFSVTGRCTVLGGAPKCQYTHEDATCPYGCSEGTCVAYSCVDVTCNLPPANYCDSGDLIVFGDEGYCNMGVCQYPSQRFFCNGQCREGKCSTQDPCLGIICNDPPAQYCEDEDTLITFAATGECTDGFCDYKSKVQACSGSCSNGWCTSDRCVGVTCNTPPADYCLNETSIMQFAETGTCLDNGHCSYKGKEHSCPEGCYRGWCL